MKHTGIVKLILLLSVISLAKSEITAQSQDQVFLKRSDLKEEQKQIWDLELKYWDAVKEGDVKKYISLYDESHLSWPDFMTLPSTKSQIQPGLERFVNSIKKEATEYQLDVSSIEIFGNLSLVYYLAKWKITMLDGTNIDNKEKFLHIWKKDDSGWRLKGGMSALLQD